MITRPWVGLTGGIASGKSTVAQHFAELGIEIIDADEASRAVVEPGRTALTEIAAEFGTGILTKTGNLNRPALREAIFAEPSKKERLEAILHPRIRQYMTDQAEAATSPYVIMMVPLLVEAGWHQDMDRVLVVDVDTETQLQRLLLRDGITTELAERMIQAQASREERKSWADDVIESSGTYEELSKHVSALHARYLEWASKDRSM